MQKRRFSPVCIENACTICRVVSYRSSLLQVHLQSATASPLSLSFLLLSIVSRMLPSYCEIWRASSTRVPNHVQLGPKDLSLLLYRTQA